MRSSRVPVSTALDQAQVHRYRYIYRFIIDTNEYLRSVILALGNYDKYFSMQQHGDLSGNSGRILSLEITLSHLFNWRKGK